MKYMIMMFGSAEGMMQTVSPEWVGEMIGFMVQLDKDLTASGELVFQAGLTDGSQAKVVHYNDGAVTTTDGPFAEAKESLIGYWVVDVASEDRVIELAGTIAKWARQVEVRALGEAPPEI
jgi:hypothetical protein